jgi:hypothetical protein
MRGKTRLLQLLSDGFHHRNAWSFLDFLALNADQQQLLVLKLREIAADEGVQTLDAVNEPLLHEEFQGAIYGGRLRHAIQRLDPIQQDVGLDGMMTFPNQLQHFPPNGRQSYFPFRTQLFGRLHGLVETASVIVIGGVMPSERAQGGGHGQEEA